MQQLNKNPKERELWDLRFYSWIENSGLRGDQFSTIGFKEAWIGLIWDTDMSRYILYIFQRTSFKTQQILMLITKKQYF